MTGETAAPRLLDPKVRDAALEVLVLSIRLRGLIGKKKWHAGHDIAHQLDQAAARCEASTQ